MSLAPFAADNQDHTLKRDFDFVEWPSQEFFCPVLLELLWQPQQTSCCGNHLSLEAVTRLQREEKPCPMCNRARWSAVLDKYHSRRVRELRVRCTHKANGCEWVGDVSELKRHVDSCVKRPWECKYCALKCTYGEGEEKHWLTCPSFPEPCPNSCEVGSVERCNMEQHRKVCSLEQVACEMKEFGCSVVVPRKELASHMKESEIQHLTALTVLNIHLSGKMHQESIERDRRITELQQDIATQKILLDEMKVQMKQIQTDMQGVMKTKLDEQTRELTELKDHIQSIEYTAHRIEQHTVGGACSGSEVFTFAQYTKNRGSYRGVYSDPFYSHHHGYKFKLRIYYYPSFLFNGIGVVIYLVKGEHDDHLQWPVKIKASLELLNQAGDGDHVVRIENMQWNKGKRDKCNIIDDNLMKYSNLEKQCEGVQYMVNDCLKFRIHVTVV